MPEYIFDINEALYNEETGEAVMKPEIKGELIRCKDCVHYKGYWCCDAWNNSPGFPVVTEDGFCNMAERRTDELGITD